MLYLDQDIMDAWMENLDPQMVDWILQLPD